MSKTTIGRGNIIRTNMIQVKLTPASVGTTAGAEQTFTVQDLAVGDFVEVNCNAAQNTNVGISNSRVSAANTLAVAFTNVASIAETPTAGLYNVLVTRCEDSPIPSNTI